MRPPLPDLDRTALLVVDMQEYFRSLARPLLPRLPPLLEALRARRVPIVYTQHGHDDPALDGGALAQWWDDHILVGTPPWRLMPEIGPRPTDPVVRKKRYSAFHDTDLARRLQTLGVRDLAIAGVMTNLCCETTARDAFVRDYRVFFLTDGTATASRAMHEASLLNLGYGFATLLDCATLVDACRGGGPSVLGGEGGKPSPGGSVVR